MALVKATLVGQLLPVFTAGLTPATTRPLQAQRISDAYNVYGLLGQSCAALPPSFVNLAVLKQKLTKAMSIWYTEPTTPARLWASAFEAYWTGALFGATGAVLSTPGTPALETALLKIFATFSYDPVAKNVDRLATALDTFTRTVIVKDTALPPPSGCQAPLV